MSGLTAAERTEELEAIRGRAVVLFDGRCGLCNGIVRFLIWRDRAGRLRYVPQESGLGQELMLRAGIALEKQVLPRCGRMTTSSSDDAAVTSGGSVAGPGLADGVILVEDALCGGQRAWVRSAAVGRTLVQVGGVWALAGRMLGWIPRGLREWGYGVVARWRYRIFGRYPVCPLPTPEERTRILGVDARQQ